MSALPAFLDTVTGVSAEQIQGILSAARRYLAMDVGFISEFTQGDRIYRFTDSGGGGSPVKVGASDPLEVTLCHQVAQGFIPGLLADTRENARAVELSSAYSFPVGALLSVPLRHPDGTPFGSLCCFSYEPRHSLNEQHLSVLNMCADVVCVVLEQERRAAAELVARRTRIRRVIEDDAIEMVFQPLYRVEDGWLTGFEALARFPQDPTRRVDSWFTEAAEVGLGLDLEFLAVRKALDALPALNEALKLTINLSPGAIVSPRFGPALADVPVNRIVVEMTEHAVVDCYDTLRQALAPYRERGLRLAIDDVGAGHSTFRHILDLSPELIKLDRTLIHNLHRDTARRALAEALTMYGRRIGCEVVAEGVEVEEELAVIRTLGMTRVQGYLLGRPMPLAQALELPPVRG
ncbi:EAL domain-containing protein [Methylobacterium sp. J-076]|uniref:sensor domain-containing phosphodiesterase n=1 Tax=Methylobacterium sp. J-076 TaxID=2836655 RepID=UPI001FB8FF18|nr:EAL domain-containing protein [Methylobacterium sp. J-076]MCJ2015781.1 EAL domain-containing protein [Methylobacterium sp. J-076]